MKTIQGLYRPDADGAELKQVQAGMQWQPQNIIFQSNQIQIHNKSASAVLSGVVPEPVHLFMSHYVSQNSERARRQREREDCPAGQQPVREEEILLLMDKKTHTQTHSSATFY